MCACARMRLVVSVCVCVCVFLRHLEQSCPLQPWLQWHLLGRMQRPPFRQGAAHTAVDRDNNSSGGSVVTTLLQ